MRTSMTTEELGEWLAEQISKMSPDEKAHVRARLNRAIGKVKTSDGKSN